MAGLEDDRTLQSFMPEAEESVARAGTPRGAEAGPLPSEDAVIEALKSVYDPEIPVNIYDLGLVYSLEIDSRGDVQITMTLTAPACPVAGMMPGRVAEAVADADGVGQVEVALVWDPPWTRDKMSDEARFALDMF